MSARTPLSVLTPEEESPVTSSDFRYKRHPQCSVEVTDPSSRWEDEFEPIATGAAYVAYRGRKSLPRATASCAPTSILLSTQSCESDFDG